MNPRHTLRWETDVEDTVRWLRACDPAYTLSCTAHPDPVQVVVHRDGAHVLTADIGQTLVHGPDGLHTENQSAPSQGEK